MFDETIDALAVLLSRYQAYCDNPSPDRWRRCTVAHNRVIATLDGAAIHIDPLIAGQVVEGGNTAATKARKILENATEEQLAMERELARLVGFEGSEVRKFASLARKALRKQRPSLSPTDTVEICTALEALRSRVRHAFETSVGEGRRLKKAHRRDAMEFMRMQLWMIGAIIVNADHQGLFHISYATSVGMACVRPRLRGALRVATCDRPVAAVDGDSQAEADAA